MTLSELLAEAQKQSGIEIKAADDSPANRALMTARLKGVSLATLMLSLTRIYDVRWTKDGATYTMHGSANDELSYRLILHQGRNLTVPSSEREARQQEDDKLANDIFLSLDRKKWDDYDSIKVAMLPEALRERLRQRFELQGQEREIILERLERIYATQRMVLRLHVGQEKTPIFRPGLFGEMELHQSIRRKMPRLMAYTTEGRFVAALFPEFRRPGSPPPFAPTKEEDTVPTPNQKPQPPDIQAPAPT
ncbi:MAG: hypothetical protein JWN98_2347 [Abditibacteriota bacterium]|nr:hypothetical protein [Abditibacteriota bacterium]